MLLKYRPADRAQKKERLLKRAQAEAEGKTPETKKPIVVKNGLNHVTYLIEQPVLAVMYLVQYAPTVGYWLMDKIGEKRVAAAAEKGNTYSLGLLFGKKKAS